MCACGKLNTRTQSLNAERSSFARRATQTKKNASDFHHKVGVSVCLCLCVCLSANECKAVRVVRFRVFIRRARACICGAKCARVNEPTTAERSRRLLALAHHTYGSRHTIVGSWSSASSSRHISASANANTLQYCRRRRHRRHKNTHTHTQEACTYTHTHTQDHGRHVRVGTHGHGERTA